MHIYDALEHKSKCIMTYKKPLCENLPEKCVVSMVIISSLSENMKLTPTQRLLAGLAVKLNEDQLDVLKNLSTLPEGVKASINSSIKFLTVLRQHCGTVAEFVSKLNEMLGMAGAAFSDLQAFGRSLYRQCRENDLSTRSTHFPMGMAKHRPSQAQSICFNSTLLRISENVTPDAVEIMVVVTPIPDASKERLRNGHNLFSKMKECGCISENDTEFLEDLMHEMKLIRALEVLEKYKVKHPPVEFPPFESQQVVPRPIQATATPYSSMPAQSSQHGRGSGGVAGGSGGVARMVSMPEVGSHQMVVGRYFARSTSSNYPGSMSSGNPSSLPSENPSSLQSGSSLFSGNSSSLSSGNSSSLSGNVGYGSFDDRSLAPLSSNRFPPRRPPSDTGSSDDFRTAPASPALPSPPPMQSQDPKTFIQPASFPPSLPPSLPSSKQQHYMSIPHNPIYAGPTVCIPVEVTPQSPPQGSHDPHPSAPSHQLMESLSRQPPTNPHYTPPQHSSEGTPGLHEHTPSEGATPGSGSVAGTPSGSAVQFSSEANSMQSYVSPTMNSNLNSNLSSNVSSLASSLGPQDTGPHRMVNPQQRENTGPRGMASPLQREDTGPRGMASPLQREDTGLHRVVYPQQGQDTDPRGMIFPLQREDTGSHEMVQGLGRKAPPVPTPPRRSSRRQPASMSTFTPPEGSSHSQGMVPHPQGKALQPQGRASQPQVQPHETQRIVSQSRGMTALPQSAFQSGNTVPLHLSPFQSTSAASPPQSISQIQSLPHTSSHVHSDPPSASYTGGSEDSLFPSSVQDVQGQHHMSVSEIGRSQQVPVPSHPAKFHNKAFGSAGGGVSLIGLTTFNHNGAGVENGHQASPPHQNLPYQKGNGFHQFGNGPGTVTLHPSQYESSGPKRFLIQRGVTGERHPMETRPAGTSGRSRRSVLDKREAMSHVRTRGSHGRLSGDYNSINEPATPSPSTPRNMEGNARALSHSESRGEIAQCSDPSPVGAPRKQLYPTLPSLRPRKRKGDSSEQEVGGAAPKRSRNLEPKAEKHSKAENGKTGYLKGMWNNVWGKLVGGKNGKPAKVQAASSRQRGTSSDSEGEPVEDQAMSADVEEQDDEDFHSCNEEAGEGD